MQFENEFNVIDTQASAMLGDFDSSGMYVIDLKILEELKNCIKIIESYSEWLITAYANVGGNKLDFEISVEEGEANLKRATLFLIEKPIIGYLEKPIKTKISEEILQDDNSFFTNIKKVFNLVIKEDSDGIDIDNSTLINIINKKKDKKDKYNSLIQESRDLDKDYLALMLNLLSKNKNYKNLILEYKNLLSQKKLSKLDKNYYRNARILLDKLINNSYSKFDQQEIKKIEMLRAQLFKELSNIKPTKTTITKQSKKKSSKTKSSSGNSNNKSNSTKNSDNKGFSPKYKKIQSNNKAITSNTHYKQTVKAKIKSTPNLFGEIDIKDIYHKKIRIMEVQSSTKKDFDQTQDLEIKLSTDNGLSL